MLNASWSARTPKSQRGIDPSGLSEFNTPGGSCIFENVVDFVAAKASKFNRIQHGSTSDPQTIQQESLRINKFRQTSTSFGIWFGTRRPEVQILSPRPFFLSLFRSSTFLVTAKQNNCKTLTVPKERTYSQPNPWKPTPSLALVFAKRPPRQSIDAWSSDATETMPEKDFLLV